MHEHLTFRDELSRSDVEHIKNIVERAGVFSPAEVDIAIELAEARLDKGDASGYFFVLAELERRTIGFTCYGPIPATDQRYEIYWIVADKNEQQTGLGGALLREAEKRIAHAGGKRIYTESSSSAAYEPARAFYSKHGYVLEARLAKYHHEFDDLCVYLKVIK